MDTMVKLASIAVVAAILSVVVRERGRSMALLLSLGSCVLVLALGMKFLSPIFTVVEHLQELSGLQDIVTAPVLKVTGIGILTQTAGGVCADADEKALEKVVQISGSVLGMYASLPLLTSVLSMLEDMLGG